jgi:hypothetical protein
MMKSEKSTAAINRPFARRSNRRQAAARSKLLG